MRRSRWRSYTIAAAAFPDPARAAALLEQATKHGNPKADYHFALHLLEGSGIAENRVTAETHLRKAALAGYRSAMVALARLHAGGFEAAQWWRAAANAGDPEAQFAVGLTYARGDGGPKRLDIAAGWFEKAAEQGYAAAQFNVGIFHLSGSGVERDPALAADWFRRAAEQGMVPAQIRLARLHFTGEGVPQDYCKAAEWLTRAATTGRQRGRNTARRSPYERQRHRTRSERSGTAAPFRIRLRLRPCLVAARPYLRRRSRGAGQAQEAIRCYRLAAEQGVLAAQLIVRETCSPVAGASATLWRHPCGSAGRRRRDMPGRNSSLA